MVVVAVAVLEAVGAAVELELAMVYEEHMAALLLAQAGAQPISLGILVILRDAIRQRSALRYPAQQTKTLPLFLLFLFFPSQDFNPMARIQWHQRPQPQWHQQPQPQPQWHQRPQPQWHQLPNHILVIHFATRRR